MSWDNDPIPETWYYDRANDRTFVVASLDEAGDAVEIQHYDGDVEEIELGEWFELDLEVIAPPEDWSGSVDRLDREDLDDGEAAARGTEPEIVPPNR